MSDQSVKPSQPASVAGGPTAGTLLRQAREANGLHVGALAVAMKVPVKKLEALEADRLDELPDAVFVRALAASVCRTLKIDPAPVLDRLPHSVAPQFAKSDRGINMPVGEPGFFVPSSFMAFVSRPPVLVVVVLLLAALAVVFFPETLSEDANVPPKPELASPSGPVLAPPVKPAKLPSEAVSTSKAEPAASAASASMVNGELTVVVVPPTKLDAGAVVPSPAKVASAPVAVASVVAPAATGLVAFKARASAWIRVRDSKGVIVFEKTLAAGESAAVPGQPPLSVVVGNVLATEVTVRGQPFSLDDVNQNNVARFEVK